MTTDRPKNHENRGRPELRQEAPTGFAGGAEPIGAQSAHGGQFPKEVS